MKTTFVIRLVCLLAFLQVAVLQAKAGIKFIILYHEVWTDKDSMPASLNEASNAWTVLDEDGSVQFSDETIRLLSDPEYRETKYPEVYDALQIPELLDKGDIPFALWTIINMYKVQPEQVRVIAYKLADHGIQGMHYLNAFYTYAFADPQIMDFADTGALSLEHPQVLEEKLLNCRMLAAYTDKIIAMHDGDE